MFLSTLIVSKLLCQHSEESQWAGGRRCFVATAFAIWSRTCHKERPSKQWSYDIAQHTSASAPRWCDELIGRRRTEPTARKHSQPTPVLRKKLFGGFAARTRLNYCQSTKRCWHNAFGTASTEERTHQGWAGPVEFMIEIYFTSAL